MGTMGGAREEGAPTVPSLDVHEDPLEDIDIERTPLVFSAKSEWPEQAPRSALSVGPADPEIDESSNKPFEVTH